MEKILEMHNKNKYIEACVNRTYEIDLDDIFE